MSRAGGSLAPTLARGGRTSSRRPASAKTKSAGTGSAVTSLRASALVNETLVPCLRRSLPITSLGAHGLERKHADIPELLTLPEKSIERRHADALRRLRHVHDTTIGVRNHHSVGPQTQARYKLALHEIVMYLRDVTSSTEATLN